MTWDHAAFDLLHRDRPSLLSWAHARSVSIVLLRAGPLEHERWLEFERSFAEARSSRLLLLLLGAVDLPAGRRRALVHAIGDRKVAAIVDTAMGRGMITSLGWSGITIESFPSSSIREALASLDPEAEGESIEQCLDSAARLLDGAKPANSSRELPVRRPRPQIALD